MTVSTTGRRRPRIVTVVVAVLCIAGSGCRTGERQSLELRDRYFAGRLDQARTTSQQLIEDQKGQQNTARLDRALVDLVSGDAASAERALRTVRDEFDHLRQFSAAEQAAAMAADDTKRAYAGEDYERILVRAFLSLASIFSGSGDAGAYALQMVDEQERILNEYAESEDSLSAGFKRVAFGPWLRAAILEERFTEVDEVRRARHQVVAWEPEFQQGHVDQARHNHSPPGHGVLYVVALVGRGPHKVQTIEQPTSQALLIADRILSAMSDHSLPPTVAPVPVARVVRDGGGPDDVQVIVEGRLMGSTQTVTDVGRLAEDQYAAAYQSIVARAVVRRVLKKTAVYALKDKLDVRENSLADFALSLGGVAWEATERADLRCWEVLPDRIQVLRIELPAGTHRVRLQPHQGKAPGHSAETTVTIDDGHTAWLLGAFPDDRLIGELQVR